MKISKSKMDLVEKAELIMLGERHIQDTTLQRMFNQCIKTLTQCDKKHAVHNLFFTDKKDLDK